MDWDVTDDKAVQLTAIELIRVVMAVVVSIAAPQFESTAAVPALKLVGLAG